MVMQGSRPENFFAAPELLGCKLDDDRKHFNCENESRERENQNIVCHKRNHSQCSAQRKRTGVAHEKQRGRHVMPQKRRDSPYADAAKCRKHIKLGDKRKHCKRAECDYKQTPREPV